MEQWQFVCYEWMGVCALLNAMHLKLNYAVNL